jgi:hypothetical protein
MSDFEDGLWSELVSEHGTQLLRMGPRPRAEHRRSWSAPLAAGGVALTGAILAAVLIFTASTSPPAYALVVNPDGSVTLTINELIGVTGANAQLARLGVRARVVQFNEQCAAKGHFIRVQLRPPRGLLPVEPELLPRGSGPFGRLRMVIHPSAIPQGDLLVLRVRAIDRTVTHAVDRAHDGAHVKGLAMSTGLYRGSVPACEDGLVTLRG